MSTISETINTALPSEARRYSNYVEPVVTALEEREHEIAETLITVATDRGLSASEAKAVVEGAGLTLRPEPEPEPEPEPVAEQGGQDIASIVRQAVAEATRPLVEFARSHGYRG